MPQQLLLPNGEYIGWQRILPRGRWTPVVGGATEREASLKLFALPLEGGRQLEMITLRKDRRP